MLVLYFVIALGVLAVTHAGSRLETCFIEQLRGKSDMEIVGRLSADYANVTLINNAYTRSNLNPVVILMPESTEDVQLVLQATKACKAFLPAESKFSVLSGGHNYAGYCLSDGVVVSMDKMKEIYWDFPNKQITVQMGVRWRDIYPRVQGTGLIPVGGGCPDVGVAGFTLGGGWSWMSRSFGLGIDNLLELDIVLANSTLITLNAAIAATNPDLANLWFSLRGAGGGNFGIVTRMKIKLNKLASPVGLNGEMCWRIERAHDAMDAYKNWLLSLPKHFGAPVILSDMYGFKRYCITVIYNGVPEEGEKLLKPMYDLLPDYVSFAHNDLSNFEVLMDGSGAATNDPGRQYTNSLIITKDNFTAELIDILLDGIKNSPNVQDTVIWHEGGGAVAEVASNATAFPYRDVFVVIQINAIWDDVADDARNVNWVDTLYAKMSKFASGSYVNYMNGKMSNYNQLYYGANLPRIQKTKNTFDPTNFFAFPAGVNPTVTSQQEVSSSGLGRKL